MYSHQLPHLRPQGHENYPPTTLRSVEKHFHATLSSAAWQEIRVGMTKERATTLWKVVDGPTALFIKLVGRRPMTLPVQQPPSMQPAPFPLSSRAKPRDLQFNGPSWKRRVPPLHRFVISTGGVMGLRPTQGDEKRLGPAYTLYRTVILSLSSRPKRSGAEGPAVPRTLRGDVFRQSVAYLRFSFSALPSKT